MIRTNLYEEGRLKSGEIRARWPFVVAIIGVATLVAAYSAWASASSNVERLRSEYESLKRSEEQLSKELADEMQRWNAELDRKNRREALLAIANGRLCWAPVLERLWMRFPDDVEITSMSGSRPGRNAATVTISGIAAGEVPRLTADKFRLTLLTALQEMDPKAKGEYSRLEDTSRKIELRNRAFEVVEFSMTFTWNP